MMKPKIFETSSSARPKPSSKQRIYRFGIRFAFLFGLLFMLYYGYCWGWWGRNSLLLQLIFQCGCPLSSQEFRYSHQIDVVIPTCRRETFAISPSGRILYVEERHFGNDAGYFWNLETGEKDSYTIPDGYKYFLTDDLLYLSLYYGEGREGGEYILDRATKIRYPLQKFREFRSDAYINGEVDLEVLAKSLKENGQVFYLTDDIVVAIASNLHVSPETSFLTGWFDLPRDQIEEFLTVHNISYVPVPVYPEYLPEVASPDGGFIARDDGIYFAETGQQIAGGHPEIKKDSYRGWDFSFYGWVYDGTGAIYAIPYGFGRCLIRYWLPYMDGSSCLIEVPQPVLKLKIPQEYLEVPAQ